MRFSRLFFSLKSQKQFNVASKYGQKLVCSSMIVVFCPQFSQILQRLNFHQLIQRNPALAALDSKGLSNLVLDGRYHKSINLNNTINSSALDKQADILNLQDVRNDLEVNLVESSVNSRAQVYSSGDIELANSSSLPISNELQEIYSKLQNISHQKIYYGLKVSKKFDKLAINRNLTRRKIKAALHLSFKHLLIDTNLGNVPSSNIGNLLLGGAFIIIPKKNFLNTSSASLQQQFSNILHKLGSK